MQDLSARLISWMVFAILAGNTGHAALVSVLRAPDSGLQPRALVGRDGVLHLIYFTGDAREGDVFYCRREPGRTEFGQAFRVNHRRGSAVAAGAIRGAQMALGRGDRVHVAWMGSQLTAGPSSPDGAKGHHRHHPNSPMLYTRMKADGSGFEPERNLVTYAWGLDGGGTIGADGKGGVYVFWHAEPTLTPGNEAGRSVYLAISRDDGATFDRERDVVAERSGACGCCGMKAFVDSQDRIHALYRTATRSGGRDMSLLSSVAGEAEFASFAVNQWAVSRCPMSSATFAEGPMGLLVGTECRGEVRIDGLDLKNGGLAFGPVKFSVAGEAKHPAIAVNAKGQILVAWLRGASFNSGGRLYYQVFAANGEAMGLPELVGAAPKFTQVSALANPQGDFELFY